MTEISVSEWTMIVQVVLERNSLMAVGVTDLQWRSYLHSGSAAYRAAQDFHSLGQGMRGSVHDCCLLG